MEAHDKKRKREIISFKKKYPQMSKIDGAIDIFEYGYLLGYNARMKEE